jgi:hypothetical protein
MEFNVESIQKTLKNFYLNNLLIACNKQNMDVHKISELISEDLIITPTQTVTATNIISENKTEQHQCGKNDYLYLKPWNKMTLIHKIIKVKEFVNSLDILEEKEKNKLKDLLIESIKEKINLKKNKVNYDSNKGKIISLSNLIFENGNYNII